MASIENRNGSWRVIFYHAGRKRHFTVGEVDALDASVYKASTEELLRLLKRNLTDIPPGCSIEDFMFHRGKPPETTTATQIERNELTLNDLWDSYVTSQQHKLEQTTLDGIRLHFGHLVRLLGGKSVVPLVSRGDLQQYVHRRSQEWIDPDIYRRRREKKQARSKPKRKYARKGSSHKAEIPERPKRHPSAATIKKEIVSLRTAWNWARRHLDLQEEFPGTHLDYPKIEEALPFMTWEEAKRRIAAGGDPDKVWGSVYLQPEEITELLRWVKARPVSAWVHPMFCFAAHTGARRSEIVRIEPQDVDLTVGVVTIREKKRQKGKLTTRSVPLSPFLKDVLADWLKSQGRGRTLFCKADGKEITGREAHNYFQRGLRLSKWSVLKGWHVFRHSFISALASRAVDQRLIDDLVGHSTEEQRRRYRHLYPDVKQQAIEAVFG